MSRSSAPRARGALLSRLAAGEFAGVWTLDPTRSTVGLRTRSVWGMVSVKGSFGEVTGEGTVAPDGNVTGSVTIGAGSIDTGNKKRDAHLRSADLLDAAQFPYILFTARELTAADADLQLAGSLQVQAVTRPVRVPVNVSASGDELVQIDAELTVDRSEFGVSWNQLGMASMINVITVRAVFTRR